MRVPQTIRNESIFLTSSYGFRRTRVAWGTTSSRGQSKLEGIALKNEDRE
jgi:hypothetical protein